MNGCGKFTATTLSKFFPCSDDEASKENGYLTLDPIGPNKETLI